MVRSAGTRKVHLTPIPLLGGLAMYAAVVNRGAFSPSTGRRAPRLWAFSSRELVAGVGNPRRPRVCSIIKSNVRGHAAGGGDPAGQSGIARRFQRALWADARGFLDAVLTVVWSWGLRLRSASSITWTALRGRRGYGIRLFFAMLAYLNGRRWLPRAAAVLGAAAGFAAGIQAAKIFMGDGGAMFLGYLMDAGLKLRLNSNHLSAWLAPVLILGVTISRYYTGHDFPLAAVVCCLSPRPGRPCRPSPFQPWSGHRGAVLTSIFWAPSAVGGRAGQLSLLTKGFPVGAGSRIILPELCIWSARLRTPGP